MLRCSQIKWLIAATVSKKGPIASLLYFCTVIIFIIKYMLSNYFLNEENFYVLIDRNIFQDTDNI